MKKIFLVLSLLTTTFAFAETGSKSFDLNYEVITAKGVCWETCRNMNYCEESEPEVFVDKETFIKLKKAELNGDFTRYSASCFQEELPRVSEHMGKIAKENIDQAEKIVQEQGQEFQIIIYNNINKDIKDFLDELVPGTF